MRVECLDQKIDWGKLSALQAAAFDSSANQHENKCLQGTRNELLFQIAEWAKSPRAKAIFWLNGRAGTGKSTIARTVARTFQQAKVLGASFFFKRGEEDRGNAMKLFPTIARQLVTSIPQLIPAIQEAINDEPDITGKSLKSQFDKLILHPLLSLKLTSRPAPTIVIVIDALDEGERDEEMRIIVQLLPLLRKSKAVCLRVFLTSRPEWPILQEFANITTREHEDLILHEVPEPVVRHDISLFLESRLSEIRKTRSLPNSWPGDMYFRRLVSLSVPLFIFAATACRVFEDPHWDPDKSLKEILAHTNDGSEFKATYFPVINRLLKGQTKRKEGILVHEFQEIVGTIVMLESPLSVISLSQFIGLPKEHIDRRLDMLHSVLDISKDPTQPVRLFHLSFRDYLLDHETREKTPFGLDPKEMHYRLTVKCLSLCESLRKNICALSSDAAYRTELDRRKVDDYLPAALQYACKYWAHHLVQCQNLNNVMHDAFLFLQTHFLHWVEAMSLLGLTSAILGILDTIQKGISGEESTSVLKFLHDATRFVLKNHQIVDKAPLQTYCAGLIFAPRTSIIRTEFKVDLPSWVGQLPHVRERWSAELQSLEGHSGWVQSVAFSPDGRLLASGSVDKTVRLWDPATGALQETLEGHSGSVLSVVFSPDGRLLASGSRDKTVRLWDLATGALQETLESHSDEVESVAFSPDGRLLASGSHDYTVRLWDLTTGTLQKTLEGHSGWVRSVAFSPDGRLLASGSHDYTIRIWDPATGALLETLEGHSGWVQSVAFSPGGRLLASGSHDYTVRLWDLATGALQEIHEGHWGSIESVAFSPDGRLLASGSVDKTVRLWDLATGALQETHEDHSGWVLSVAFSPDGRLLASGSHDNTVRLWDLATGALQEIHEGHSGEVLSVAFSPDGRLLASGSHDYTVRLWDPATGALQKTLVGHSGSVLSVAFSPDGRLLASGSHDYTVRLWDPATGALQKTLEGHWGSVLSVAFSPDGRLLASHNTVRVTEFLFFQDGSLLNTNLGTFDVQSGRERHASNSIRRNLAISIKHRRWITLNGEKVLWLPPDSRPSCSTINGDKVALGHKSGRISFLEFRL